MRVHGGYMYACTKRFPDRNRPDAHQEVLLKAWRQLQTFRFDRPPRIFLSYVARSALTDLLRSFYGKRGQKRAITDALSLTKLHYYFQSTASTERPVTFAELEPALEQLADKPATFLQLRCRGLSEQQAADAAGYGTKIGARGSVRYALKWIRENMPCPRAL